MDAEKEDSGIEWYGRPPFDCPLPRAGLLPQLPRPIEHRHREPHHERGSRSHRDCLRARERTLLHRLRVFEVPSNLAAGSVRSPPLDCTDHGQLGPCCGGDGVVVDETSLYVFRILLGVAEAGFFPGVLLYLTYWFPRTVRVRLTGCSWLRYRCPPRSAPSCPVRSSSISTACSAWRAGACCSCWRGSRRRARGHRLVLPHRPAPPGAVAHLRGARVARRHDGRRAAGGRCPWAQSRSAPLWETCGCGRWASSTSPWATPCSP